MSNASFPLFNQLIQKKFPNIGLNDTDKQMCVHAIKSMSSHEHELIFALIRTYQFETNENSFHTLPYKSKHQKNGIKFDMDKLPNELQHILYEFTRLHVQSTHL